MATESIGGLEDVDVSEDEGSSGGLMGKPRASLTVSVIDNPDLGPAPGLAMSLSATVE